jgi:voltage-gated potassium channel
MRPSVRFAVAFCLLVALVTGGTVGYMVIEGWSIGDSLYMTVITVTTVGYGEVQKLSDSGRFFTILLLLLSIAIAGYSVSTLISFIFEGQIVQLMRGRRMHRSISNLSDHYIICGCGVVGKEVALEFKHAGVPFVIIERDPDNSELGRDESILFVEGDAEEEDTLTEAGIERAKGLVAALRQDENNVFVVLTARQMQPELTIVARAAEEKTEGKLIRAGADRVISPYQIAGRRIASVILRPTVMNFLDVVVEGGDVTMRLEEVTVRGGCDLVGKALRDSGIGKRTGAIIIGIHGRDGNARVDRTSETPLSTVVIEEGDVLIALGSEDHIKTLRAYAEGA